MRLLPYRLFCASMVTAVIAMLVVWSLLWWDGEPFAVALLVFAAVYFAALGMAIVTDWNGAMRQLCALQRMQGSKKGRL
jgi:ABC-type Fe3+-siderophore transport system permease subunit